MRLTERNITCICIVTLGSKINVKLGCLLLSYPFSRYTVSGPDIYLWIYYAVLTGVWYIRQHYYVYVVSHSKLLSVASDRPRVVDECWRNTLTHWPDTVYPHPVDIARFALSVIYCVCEAINSLPTTYCSLLCFYQFFYIILTYLTINLRATIHAPIIGNYQFRDHKDTNGVRWE